MGFRESLTSYVRASYPALWVQTYEEVRAQSDIQGVAFSLDIPVHIWSVTRGMVTLRKNQDAESDAGIEAPGAAIQWLASKIQDAGAEGYRALAILRDFEAYPANDPVVDRAVRDLIPEAKAAGLTIIFLSTTGQVPARWVKAVHPLPFVLPTREDLGLVLDGVIESALEGGKKIKLENGNKDRAIEAALGLTVDEAENAYALSLIETGKVNADIVAREKARTLAKGGLVEVVDAKVDLDAIGGLENIKAYLAENKSGFSKKARLAGVPLPAGFLAIGCPGTGKSLIATATASYFGLPLLVVNVGNLKGGLVGETESKTRACIEILRACAPCVVLLDEVEKAFAGAGGKALDGGASEGQFGAFLNFLNDRVVKQEPVFVVATANNVSMLPPEFQRAGRFDAVFAVDLPTIAERREIVKIHLGKKRTADDKGRSIDQFDTDKIAQGMVQFTGAEIEQAVVRGIKKAFARGVEMTTDILLEAARTVMPLAKTRPVEVSAIREFIQKGGGEPASAPENAGIAAARAFKFEMGEKD